MKKIFNLLLLLCLMIAVPAKAEEVKRDGNNFTVIKTVTNSQDVKTVYTYTIKDTVYPIYITKNGRCYIIRTSKNGNEYRQYLSKEISLEICKELNTEYKE